MISIDERVSYYLCNYARVEEPEWAMTGYDKPIKLTLEGYYKNYQTIHPNTMYPVDVSRLLRYAGEGHKLYIQCGDSPYSGPEWPVMVKVRDSINKTNGIITNLNTKRHWQHVFHFNDTDWDYKLNDFMWRGADTGDVRYDFVTRFHKKYNVGFSEFVQNPDKYKKELVKPKVAISEFLKYKYLPVVDGNDKSSSLGWILSSGSVPLMPIPRFHSWICEPWLKPGVHFVEVKRDFSDLLEKIKWCKNNDETCKEIAENGKKFMLQFTNPKQEEYIERKLVKSIITNTCK